MIKFETLNIINTLWVHKYCFFYRYNKPRSRTYLLKGGHNGYKFSQILIKIRAIDEYYSSNSNLIFQLDK